MPLREASFAVGKAGRVDAAVAKTAVARGAVGRIRGEMDGKRDEATWDVTWATRPIYKSRSSADRATEAP